MYANYHTHTWRCGHAEGSERAYIERAIEGGYRILGFSDHTPQFYDGDYYPAHQKMRPEMMDDYVTTILDLKAEYSREIRIFLGLEVEYFPKYYERLMRFLEPYPLDYLLLGQHSLGNGGPEDLFVFSPTSSEEDLVTYVNQCMDALKTGRFLYLAHPDVLHFTGDPAVYLREMQRLCICAKELSIPLEINLHGLADGRHYPNPAFWKLAAATGNDVVIGCDAHWPEAVWRPEVIAKAESMALAPGLHLLPELPLA